MGSGEENYRVYMIYIKIRPPHTLSQKYIFSMTKCMSIKLDGHLDGLYLRNHDFSGETKNWLEP